GVPSLYTVEEEVKRPYVMEEKPAAVVPAYSLTSGDRLCFLSQQSVSVKGFLRPLVGGLPTPCLVRRVKVGVGLEWDVRATNRHEKNHRWKESPMRAKRLTLQQRREIFHALVLTQDVVTNVPRSRQIVTEKFEITETQLKQIEDEGLEKEWPPL